MIRKLLRLRTVDGCRVTVEIVVKPIHGGKKVPRKKFGEQFPPFYVGHAIILILFLVKLLFDPVIAS